MGRTHRTREPHEGHDAAATARSPGGVALTASARAILRMQHTLGNRATSSILALQRAKADVRYQVTGAGPQLVVGPAVGQGGVGGQTHSEQRVWASARTAILAALGTPGAALRIDFDVDTTVCHLCAPWFEQTVWPALNAARGAGSTFQLFVNVGGGSVPVTGGTTIWTREVADVATFDRLPEYDRAVRLLNENRTAGGALEDEDLSEHVTMQSDALQAVVNTYGGVGARILTARDTGRGRAIVGQAPAFQVSQAVMTRDLSAIDLFEIIKSARFTIPEFNTGGNRVQAQTAWYRLMEDAFQGWMEEKIQELYEEQRVPGKYW